MNNEFCVLHLSDLHIKNLGSDNYSVALRNLISDIGEQTKGITNIILVVSGDIIDRGDYRSNMKTAVKFFKALSREMDDRIIDVQIVPGNHDKERNDINNLISIAHSKVGIAAGKAAEWKEQQKAYASFLQLINEVYPLFGKHCEIENTFGVESKVVAGTNICLMRFDTAWCSYSESEVRELRIGGYQRESLKNAYQSLINKAESEDLPITLTLGISHHPLNWLKADEEDVINSYVMARDYLNMDVLMCGHVHDREVLNYFNHEHSLMTLVTGIGGGKERAESKEEHRYSIYLFNPSYNSCEIIMRMSKADLSFDYDYFVYTAKHEKKANKLCYPIKIKESHPFIPLSSPDPNKTKSVFVDKCILDDIVRVSDSIAKFGEDISRLYERYKIELIDNLSEDLEPGILKRIHDYLYEGEEGEIGEVEYNILNSEKAYGSFLAMLNEICEYFVSNLKTCFPADPKLRAHFRRYNKTRKCFTKLCHYSNQDYEATKPMQDVKWDSLIKPAYECEKPLIFSANKDFNNIETDWDDFITLVPRFNNYTDDVRIRKGVNERRPMLTFGLSVKFPEGCRDSTILYILDYMNIDEKITTVVDEYIRIFGIDIKPFLRYIELIEKGKNKPI